ncbi:MAG TPA: DegT/DnrJ/EryC1/StrS aminotransferase family protein [Nitrospira sp.]|nr:DegT/DnrJ/EryC1/StrS aminotransferase family protein [Nitrospira sp.]
MADIKPFFFDFTEAEIEEFQEGAAQILRSGTLILGDYTERFERQFADYIGCRYAISVNSGSTALEFLNRIKGISGKRVLVPTNTNFATVAAIPRAGGIVQYLDMDPKTFAPTLEMVEAQFTRCQDIAGVLWVHIGGIISPEFFAVRIFCQERGAWVVEDCAHAHGSQLRGRKAGSLADGGAFSFFPTKVMTTCEGGMITTDSADEDRLARSLRNQGKREMNYGGLHHDFGNSSRMTELNALLGSLQLRKLPAMLQRRARAASVIAKELDRAGVVYCSTSHMEVASNYKLIVLLPEGRSREAVKKALVEEGVQVGGGVYEIPCHRQPVFEDLSRGVSLPNAERWCPRHLCPPVTSGMTEDEARFVGEMLAKYLG